MTQERVGAQIAMMVGIKLVDKRTFIFFNLLKIKHFIISNHLSWYFFLFQNFS